MAETHPTDKYNEGVREQRFKVAGRYFAGLDKLRVHPLDPEVEGVISFFEANLRFAQPLVHDEKWGFTISARDEPTAIGLALMLRADMGMHEVLDRYVIGRPSFNDEVHCIILPPRLHRLRRATRTAVLIHEGVHAMAFIERGQEVLTGKSEQFWLEELRAYRVEDKVLRTLLGRRYDELIDTVVDQARKDSTLPTESDERYSLVIPGLDRVDYSSLFPWRVSGANFEYLLGPIQVMAVEILLRSTYPHATDADIDHHVAGFIRYMYGGDSSAVE